MELYLEPGPYDAQTRGLRLAALSPRTRFAVKLYFRCAMFNEIALPDQGGVLDQSEMLCSMLEAVHSNVIQIRSEQMEAVYRPTPAVIKGVDPRLTENVTIGNQYRKRVRR